MAHAAMSYSDTLTFIAEDGNNEWADGEQIEEIVIPASVSLVLHIFGVTREKFITDFRVAVEKYKEAWA